MLEEVIDAYKKQFSGLETYETLLNNIDSIKIEINKQNDDIKFMSRSFLKKIKNRVNINKCKSNIVELEAKLALMEQEKLSYVEEKRVFELLKSKSYSELFDNNIKNFFAFTKEKNILINFESLENDFHFKPIESPEKIGNLDDLMLVRKTDYIPENGLVYSGRFSPTDKKENFEFDGSSLNYNGVNSDRTTSHWCLNKEVVGHGSGDWLDKKVTIVEPFTEDYYKKAVSLGSLSNSVGEQ